MNSYVADDAQYPGLEELGRPTKQFAITKPTRAFRQLDKTPMTALRLNCCPPPLLYVLWLHP